MYIKIDDKNRVIMRIVDKFAEGLEHDNVTTFRTDKEPTTANGEMLFFNPQTKTFYTEKVEVTEEQNERANTIANARLQKANALKWLSDNDWKVNKRMLGEWADDDERWIAYLDGRANARADIDEADAILNDYTEVDLPVEEETDGESEQ